MNRIDLSGKWKLWLDREKSGVESETVEKGEMVLPGILQGQGFGDEITRETDWVSSLHDPMWYLREEYQGAQEQGVKVPFLAQPPKHYLGWAWYERRVEIPKEGFYELVLECTHWRTVLFIDGNETGSVTTLCAPHKYQTGKLTEGIHEIRILVDNGMQYPYRPDGHGVSDALGATWNGMVGELSLNRVPAVMVERVWIETDVEERKAILRCLLQNQEVENELLQDRETRDNVVKVKLHIRYGAGQEQVVSVELDSQRREQEAVVELAYPKSTLCWDEYGANLQEVEVSLEYEGDVQVCRESFGFRQIEAREEGFFVNGRPTYMRGTHFGGDFPLTGYPATKKEEWKRIFLICKKWGMNFMRFHSYCPPKAAFEAADELGYYLQVECAMWNRFQPGDEMSEILWEETKKILDAFGNHPSFVMLSPSNEPGGNWLEPLTEWVRRAKGRDGRRLYTVQSGWHYPVPPKEITGTDYVYFHRSGFGPYTGGNIRNHEGWFGKDYGPSLEEIHYPVIAHEMGQWCAYPDFSVMDKFRGYLQPGNYEVFRAQAKKKGVLAQNKELAYASGKLQVQMDKEEFEANFRTPHLYGFEMLDLHDYLGQGTALVGVLDAFWEEKGYIKPEEFREFCDETVLLLRIPKYVYTREETLQASVEIAHFGEKEYEIATIFWRLKDTKGKVEKEEIVKETAVHWGKNQMLGEIEILMEGLEAPAAYQIELEMKVEGKTVKNHWNIWNYPVESEENNKMGTGADEAELIWTRDVQEAKTALAQGKTVILTPIPSRFSYRCPPVSFKPSFWNSQMGPRFARGMGILCDKNHPALAAFPTEGYSQWQWEGIVHGARGINMEGMPPDLKPVVQAIDDWNRSYRLALILEARVGRGRLLLLGCDLERNVETYPQKAQLKRSLLKYALSNEFDPKTVLTPEQAFSWCQDTGIMKKLGARVWMEEHPETDASACISGNPAEVFALEHTEFPIHLHLKWEKRVEVEGFTYVPIQNRRNHEGEIREYEIWCREGKQDGWKVMQRGEFISSFEPKKISFDRVWTDEVLFVIKSGFAADKYPSWIERGNWKQCTGRFEDSSVGIAEVFLHVLGDWADEPDSLEENRHVIVEKTATKEIEE